MNTIHNHDSSRRLRRSVALAAAIAAVGGLVSGAGAAGSDPYTLQAQALLSPSGTDLTLRVEGPTAPAVLEKIQVKWWPGVDDARTVNLFDIAAPGGVATVQLTGPARAHRLEIRVHVKDGPQHNLDAETTVLRRPDFAVTAIDVPPDIVRTRSFDAAVTVAEVGGDSAASARLVLFDGAEAVGQTHVIVGPGAASVVRLPLALARPGAHTLRAVISDAAPAEWDVAANTKELPLYVHHYGANGVVATDHPLATEVGVDILRAGGNAFDAAVAVQFALNVTQPHLAGIGGGSNVLVRLGDTGKVLAIDARETASAATAPTTFAGLSLAAIRPNGFAVGVPGTLRALEYMLDEWGTTTLAEAVEPAISLAEAGFPIGFSLARNIVGHRSVFQPETAQIFLTPAGDPRPERSTLLQPDLAKTFRLIAQHGADVFYRGEIAQAIVAAQRRGTPAARQGKMTTEDLAAYSIDVESPLSLDFRGYDVVGPPPSTNGGLVLLESLGLIREFLADPRNDGYEWGFGTRNSLHVFIEAMRLAFADRDWWIGDDRFTDVPVDGLLDPRYLRERSALIGRETTMCNPVPAGNAPAYTEVEVADAGEVGHTTHASIIDRWGNAVVITSTIADAFGTGITVPGYGFLLNDSGTLFNLSPRANAATGNPGANDAGGGKRPAGSMAPTLILKDGEPYAATGTYSGGFIPSVVLNVVLNLLEFELPLQEAIDAPRIWTATAAGAAQLNFGLDHLITPLRAMGHVGPAFGGCADNLNRTPLPPLLNLGSAASFGVDLGDFSLVGGQDGTRWPDASTVVVERN